MDAKTPVEKLQTFLEIEDEELSGLSLEDMQDEVRLLGVDPDKLSVRLRGRLSELSPDSTDRSLDRTVGSNIVISGSDIIHHYEPNPKSFAGSWFVRVSRFLTEFFQFFSKTDRAILAHCSHMAGSSQTSIGAMVFIPGVLAFISGAFALYTAFHSILVAVLVGFLYGSLIVILDRELVSFTSKATVIPKLAIAIFCGIVVSAPLELKLFDGRIAQEIELSRLNENRIVLDRQSQTGSVYEAKISRVERDIDDYKQGIINSASTMEAEAVGRQVTGRTGMAGQGPVYAEARRLKETYERLLNQSEAQLVDLKAARDQEFAEAKQDYDTRKQSASYDLLARREVLGKIAAYSPPAFYMIWGLRLLLVLIQVLPILIMLLMPANDYTAIMEAERRKGIARVNAIGNEQLAEIMNNPYSEPLPIISVRLGGVKAQGENSLGQGKQALAT